MEQSSSDRPYRLLGARIKELTEAKGISGRKWGVELGLSESYPSKIMSGENRPSAELLHEIARRLGGDPQELEYLAGYRSSPPDREPVRPAREGLRKYLERVPYEVPVYEQEAAAAMASGAEPVTYVPVPPNVRPTRRDLWALTVRGESLQPSINAGDIVVIDPDRSPSPGDYVVARVDNTVMVKRYEVQADGQVALTGNNGTRPMEGEGDSVLGVVVYRVTVY